MPPAQILIAPEERRNLTAMYRKMRAKDLDNMSDAVPFSRFFNTVLNRTLNSSDEVIVYAQEFFPELAILVEETDTRFDWLFSKFIEIHKKNPAWNILSDKFFLSNETSLQYKNYRNIIFWSALKTMEKGLKLNTFNLQVISGNCACDTSVHR